MNTIASPSTFGGGEVEDFRISESQSGERSCHIC